MTEKFEIDIIQIPKIKEDSGNDKLLDWLYFIENQKSEMVIEKMQENEELKEADEKMLNEDYEVTVYDGEGYDEYPEESGNGIAKVAIGLVGSAVAAVGTAVIVKNKDRISNWKRERKIKKLEDEGYIVIDPEIDEAEVVEPEQDKSKQKKKSEKVKED